MKDDSDNIRQELKQRAPFLYQLKESSMPEGFEAPPGYFQHLPGQLTERLRNEESSRSAALQWGRSFIELLSLLRQPRLAAGLATVAVLVTAGLLILVKNDESHTSARMFDALTIEEVNTYIQSNLDEFGEEMVIEAAETFDELSLIPAPVLEDEALEEEYLKELLLELDEESMEELL